MGYFLSGKKLLICTFVVLGVFGVYSAAQALDVSPRDQVFFAVT